MCNTKYLLLAPCVILNNCFGRYVLSTHLMTGDNSGRVCFASICLCAGCIRQAAVEHTVWEKHRPHTMVFTNNIVTTAIQQHYNIDNLQLHNNYVTITPRGGRVFQQEGGGAHKSKLIVRGSGDCCRQDVMSTEELEEGQVPLQGAVRGLAPGPWEEHYIEIVQFIYFFIYSTGWCCGLYII